MRKFYRYTRLKQDGTSEIVAEQKKKIEHGALVALVGGDLELVPSAYYAGKGWGRVDCYADEDARHKGGGFNPHFHDLGGAFFIPGDVIRVETVKNEAADV